MSLTLVAMLGALGAAGASLLLARGRAPRPMPNVVPNAVPNAVPNVRPPLRAERATEVRFYLYFPNLVAAHRAAAESALCRLDTRRLAVGVERAALRGSWLCVVSIHTAPTAASLGAARAELRALASSHGGALDGWEVAVGR